MFAYGSEAAGSNEVFSWESIYAESKATSLLKSRLLVKPQGGDNASVLLLFLVAFLRGPSREGPLWGCLLSDLVRTGSGVSSHRLGARQGAVWE